MEENDVTTPIVNPVNNFRNVSGYLFFAIIGGLGASLICAGIWALITVLTKYQIGYMALGMGALVGLAIRYFGEGKSILFGIIGAIIALLGCLLGNLLSQIAFYAMEQGMNVIDIILTMDYSQVPQILGEAFQPVDLIFYAVAVFEGFRFSINKSGQNLKVPENGEPVQQTRYPLIKKLLLAFIFIIISVISIPIFMSFNKDQTFTYPSGKIQAQGKLSGGQAEGIWIYWYESGQKQAEIEFKRNKKDGIARFYYESGILSGEETYSKGLLHGSAKTYAEDGQLTMEGTYQYDRMNGLFKTYGENNVLLNQGNYKLDLQDGKWEYYYENGDKKVSGVYKKGELIGLWNYWYEDGKNMKEVEYKGDEEFIINYWDKNGRLLVDDGNGILTDYYENGKMMSQGKIQNEKKIEKWNTWYENGKLKEEVIYTDNKPALLYYWGEDGSELIINGNGTLTLFYLDGKKMYETHYIDGYVDGKSTFWHINGNISFELTYKMGKLDGDSVYYYENSIKSTCGNIKNGERDGKWQWWNEDGTLSSEATYVNGAKEGIQEFWSNEVKTKIEYYEHDELLRTEVL